ncbi:hypothetical protein HQO38_20475 [Rhodococcus fascians]|nr:hypothetical protein [Rhodococcus fascians]MBY4140263.1 hypothetical protein [Rhodococcus fascians]MBY4218928.1 hypothetical protein [Rhodococcus fascians]MBY4223808.1 hypothetical protein [Rhodococcus fascians]MBY4234289.1 hypothetical protein [Rhodococcus fascians]
MLRLQIDDDVERAYVLTFLSTPTGQALLTRSKTGNVIDHLSANDLSSVHVPFFEASFTGSVAKLMTRAVKEREKARLRLDQLVQEFEATLPAIKAEDQLKNGWTQNAAALCGRLDSAAYVPAVDSVRRALSEMGGQPVKQVADAFMPNRYKRLYVESGFGRPILSGRQLLQINPVNLQYIAAHALDVDEFALGVGTLVFGARGRAEERIALPALITEERASWLASHNVMRVRPHSTVNPGWLYLCFATEHVQIQVKASAFGSVIDVVDPANLGEVVLPKYSDTLGSSAFDCWRSFEAANELEKKAISMLETKILESAGVC